MKLVRVPSSVAALGIPGTVTPTSLTLRPNVPFKAWLETVGILKRIEGGVQWWIGDALNYGEHAYGEKYGQAVDESQAAVWMQYTYVARRFEISRRLENVPWSVHQALAGIEDDRERYAALRRAGKERWTVAQARERAGGWKQIAQAMLDAPFSDDDIKAGLRYLTMKLLYQLHAPAMPSLLLELQDEYKLPLLRLASDDDLTEFLLHVVPYAKKASGLPGLSANAMMASKICAERMCGIVLNEIERRGKSPRPESPRSRTDLLQRFMRRVEEALARLHEAESGAVRS